MHVHVHCEHVLVNPLKNLRSRICRIFKCWVSYSTEAVCIQHSLQTAFPVVSIGTDRLLACSSRTQWHFPVPDSPLLSFPGESNGWGLFMKPLPPAWSIKPRRDDTKSSVSADSAQPFTWTLTQAGTRMVQECLKVGHLNFWENELLL